MRRFLFLVASVLLLAGCNTIINKSFQEVRVVTPGVEGVDCVLETDKIKYRVLTPGSTMVERSPYPMTITCEKAYYFTASDTFKPKIRMGWSALNVWNGVVPGTAWDVGSRSIYAYPELISIEMAPDTAALEAARAEFVAPAPVLTKKPVAIPESALSTAGDKAFDKALNK